jgi:prolyl oligopeptidase
MSPLRVALSGALIQLALASVAVAADIRASRRHARRPVTESLHGVTLDRYRWLEDVKNAEVQSWTRAQPAATVGYLDRAAPPISGMKDELSRYFDRNRTDAPFFKYGREFFRRVLKGEPQAKLYTRLDGKEVLLFDPVAADPSGKTRLGSIVPNRDGSKLAVGIYTGGSEIQDVRITNSRTGAAIGPLIKGVSGFHWARDRRFAYFTPRTAESDAKRSTPLRPAPPGWRPQDDEVLIRMQDAKNYCSVYEPEEAEVTVFETGDFWSNTIRIRPISSRAEPKTIYSSDKFKAEATFVRTASISAPTRMRRTGR